MAGRQKKSKKTTTHLVPEQAKGHRVGNVEGQRFEVEAGFIELEVDAPSGVL